LMFMSLLPKLIKCNDKVVISIHKGPNFCFHNKSGNERNEK
jgi:hypothetical protein